MGLTKQTILVTVSKDLHFLLDYKMASMNSLIRSLRQVNKVLLNGRTYNLHQRNIPPVLNHTCTIFSSSSSDAVESDKKEEKDIGELEKLLAEKEKMLEDSKKEALDFKDRYVRSLAEGENIRKRGLKQVSDSKLYAIQGLAKDLFEVADILEKATESVPEEERSKNEHLKHLYDGVVMTEIELQKVFKKHGLEKVDPLDEPFDPNFHEALFQFPVEGKASGTVANVQKIGYKLNGRALRAAKVGVVP